MTIGRIFLDANQDRFFYLIEYKERMLKFKLWFTDKLKPHFKCDVEGRHILVEDMFTSNGNIAKKRFEEVMFGVIPTPIKDKDFWYELKGAYDAWLKELKELGYEDV